jgi:hypothetical protein
MIVVAILSVADVMKLMSKPAQYRETRKPAARSTRALGFQLLPVLQSIFRKVRRFGPPKTA